MARRPTAMVEEALNQYMESRRHLAKSTQYNDTAVLRAFARGVGENRELGYVTAGQVEAYFRTLDGQQPSSWNKIRQRVANFLAYAQRHGWVHSDLLVDVPKRRVPRVERLRLSPEELVRLVDTPEDPRDRALIALAVNTGLRAGEITQIKLKDLDLDEGRLYIYRSKTQQDDVLKITPALSASLRSWLRDYAAELRRVPLDGDMFLFPARTAPTYRGINEGWRRGKLRPEAKIRKPHQIVQRAMLALGFEVTLQEGLHTVRRSVARAMFEKAADVGYDNALRMTAALLGHKSTVTTEQYIGVSADRKKRDALMATDFLPFGQEADVIKLHEAR